MSNLTAEENNSISQSAKGNVIATAVARVYTANGGGWVYNDIWGALLLVSDKNTHYFRVVNLSNSSISWEQELYTNLEYLESKPLFHIFEGKDSIIGFSFADENDAGHFLQATRSVTTNSQAPHSQPPPPVASRERSGSASESQNGFHHTPEAVQEPHSVAPPPRPGPMAPARPTGAPAPAPRPAAPSRPPNPVIPPPSSAYEPPSIPPPTPQPMVSSYAAPPPAASPHPPVNRTVSTTSFPSQPAPAPAPTPVAASHSSAASGNSSRKKGSGFGFGKKFLSKIGFGEEEAAPDIQITVDHSTFRHESHIGWDPANGFEIRNIPPQWRKLFQAAGVKKSELKDADTAKFIMETVAEAAVGINPVAVDHSSAPSAPSGGPPPPTGGPPPPMGGPPAPMGGPPAPSGGPPPSGGGGGGGGGIFAGLGTVQLKKAEERPAPSEVDLTKMKEDEKDVLANTLAKAMEQRRDAFQVDSDDFASEEEWSS